MKQGCLLINQYNGRSVLITAQLKEAQDGFSWASMCLCKMKTGDVACVSASWASKKQYLWFFWMVDLVYLPCSWIICILQISKMRVFFGWRVFFYRFVGSRYMRVYMSNGCLRQHDEITSMFGSNVWAILAIGFVVWFSRIYPKSKMIYVALFNNNSITITYFITVLIYSSNISINTSCTKENITVLVNKTEIRRFWCSNPCVLWRALIDWLVSDSVYCIYIESVFCRWE